jgi:dihydrofolate reductase
MPTFHAIAAMSENRVIGAHGKIPWHLSEDFRWFKHRTMGGTLIMGRKTYESIGRPLPGRETVVLSRTTVGFEMARSCRSMFDLDKALAKLPPPYWVCGGADIYAQLLPKSAVLYLTRVKGAFPGDAFLPAFENIFHLDQLIHETEEFRIERWFNRKLPHPADYPQERWPAR